MWCDLIFQMHKISPKSQKTVLCISNLKVSDSFDTCFHHLTFWVRTLNLERNSLLFV